MRTLLSISSKLVWFQFLRTKTIPLFRYKVMAGTPEKVLEHLLETRMNAYNYEEQFNKESLFEDFLLTFPIFISWKQMIHLLLRQV